MVLFEHPPIDVSRRFEEGAERLRRLFARRGRRIKPASEARAIAADARGQKMLQRIRVAVRRRDHRERKQIDARVPFVLVIEIEEALEPGELIALPARADGGVPCAIDAVEHVLAVFEPERGECLRMNGADVVRLERVLDRERPVAFEIVAVQVEASIDVERDVLDGLGESAELRVEIGLRVDGKEQEVAAPVDGERTQLRALERAAVEALAARYQQPALAIRPAVVRAARRLVAAVVHIHAGAAVRAAVVERDELARIVEDHDFADCGVEAHEIAVVRKLPAVTAEMPVAMEEVRIEIHVRASSRASYRARRFRAPSA
ncbi:hypothetical protein Y043_6342 [Burkholderia pseudomallei MSHR2138]|nr:hypothetical protein Y043_6342 [Burkholderia pseudomallei MSHR2138]